MKLKKESGYMEKVTGNFFSNEYESLEMLADLISEELECPITIEDDNHRIIAYSRHEDEVDPVRIATIMRRRVPENVINSLWKVGAIPKLFETEEPVVVPRIDQVGIRERVAISVRKNKEVVGFIWAHPSKPFDEQKIIILQEAAKAVKNQLIQRQKQKTETEKNYEELFWKLLTGHFTRLRDLEQVNERYNLVLKGMMTVVIVDFLQPVNRSVERQTNYLVETMQQLPIIARTFDNGQLILLVRLPEKEKDQALSDFINNLIGKIKERQNISGIVAASGSMTDNPLALARSYQEALYVLKVKQQFPSAAASIFGYEKLGVFQFIEDLAVIRKRSGYQNLAIEKLSQYDDNHHANLQETIFTFLQYDGNMNDAAKALHIHANTLAYRLKRISEIADINLKDANQKMTLYLDLLIKQLEEENL
ncbi:Regulator of polyketide synthase expression [Bacillus badius]|uniref:Regulator of polyketide synthase expression n=2 Tax=Bacillus badius TaxID=1455 RepID=A0ABR5B1A8_BACBA|nr:Regulator of polyketide synthase expression [Bacillus badius]KIL80782.1 Regulator of polyketide synthase expression [Bacillus badius]